MAVRRGSTFPVRPAAPIKGLSAGDGARCPPLPPRATFLSTFSQVAPTDASLPTRPFLPAELLQLRREEGERKAFCRPGGPALVPELHFEEKLTGATFRRRPLHERLAMLTAITGAAKPASGTTKQAGFLRTGAFVSPSGSSLFAGVFGGAHAGDG